MNYSISINPLAKTDIQDAISWYNEKQKGLGKRFFEHLDETFELLSKNPFYQIKYQNVRCFPLKKFPYTIHYTIDNNKIIIQAIFHTSQSPTNWFQRR